jgi:hypothetical protein
MTVAERIREAITNLKQRKGSSLQAIKVSCRLSTCAWDHATAASQNSHTHACPGFHAWMPTRIRMGAFLRLRPPLWDPSPPWAPLPLTWRRRGTPSMRTGLHQELLRRGGPPPHQAGVEERRRGWHVCAGAWGWVALPCRPPASPRWVNQTHKARLDLTCSLTTDQELLQAQARRRGQGRAQGAQGGLVPVTPADAPPPTLRPSPFPGCSTSPS